MIKLLYSLIIFSLLILKINSQGTIVLDALIYDETPSRDNDFQIPSPGGVVKGLVKTDLGSDNTPTLVDPQSATIHSPESFNAWFHNVPGTNLPINYQITLTQSTTNPNVYVYTNDAFFPIDGQGFDDKTKYPNEQVYRDGSGTPHNFHFCMQIHTMFTYKKGDTFKFNGDDDVWVFMNKKLVVDLGGIHTKASASISLDTLGLTVGSSYPFDFFYCERHTTESHIEIETSLQLTCPNYDECGVCQGDGSSCCTKSNCENNPTNKIQCITAQCSNNVCVKSVPSCPSTDPCTTGTCIPNVGCLYLEVTCNKSNCETSKCNKQTNTCEHTPIDNCVSCKNGPCITTDLCHPLSCDNNGNCVRKDKDCDDGNYCTTDSCREGICYHTPISKCINCDSIGCITTDECNPQICSTDGKSCINGELCVDKKNCTDDICLLGKCFFVPKYCDDNDDCTIDSCSETTGCIHTPLDNCVACSGIPCITKDYCNQKLCTDNGTKCTDVPKSCDDGDACTIDSCISPNGSCSHERIQNCDNCGTFNCITLDKCNPLVCPTDNSTTCINETKTCNDDKPCTLNQCHSPDGICSATPIPDCVVCNQTNIGCLTVDFCHPVVCSNNGDSCVTTDRNCNDYDYCTIDSCQNGQCKNEIIDNCENCTNGIGCTTTDFCFQNVCSDTGDSCITVPLNCSDGLRCTNEACIGPNGTCTHTRIENCIECENEACITQDLCFPVVCSPDGHCIHNYTAVTCDDHDACTSDVCTEFGCEHYTYTGCMNCTDGGCFTFADRCNHYGCNFTGDGKCFLTRLECDDNDPCTYDSCLYSGDCIHEKIEGCTPPPTHTPTNHGLTTLGAKECDCCPQGQYCLLIFGHERCFLPSSTGGIPEETIGCPVVTTSTSGGGGGGTGHYTESGTGNQHLCDRHYCKFGEECYIINGIPECLPSNYKCLDCLDLHCEKQGGKTCFMIENQGYKQNTIKGCKDDSCCKYIPTCR
ncbi:hypothetical protein ACTFIV_006552 [Dictyostelium citrinum]